MLSSQNMYLFKPEMPDDLGSFAHRFF